MLNKEIPNFEIFLSIWFFKFLNFKLNSKLFKLKIKNFQIFKLKILKLLNYYIIKSSVSKFLSFKFLKFKFFAK